MEDQEPGEQEMEELMLAEEDEHLEQKFGRRRDYSLEETLEGHGDEYYSAGISGAGGTSMKGAD